MRKSLIGLILLALFLVGFTLVVSGRYAHVEAKCESGVILNEGRSPVEFLGSNCRVRLYAEDSTPTPTEPRASPTPTKVVTVEPTMEPTPIETVLPTSAPTLPPEPTSTGHDDSACHGALDGHTHGMCFSDLPNGPVKSFISDNMWIYNLDNEVKSSPTENTLKHDGFKFLFAKFNGCQQFGNSDRVGNDSCITEALFRVHSLGIAEAMRTPNSKHSIMVVANICDQSLTNCGVGVFPEVESYGEVHSQYKKTGCFNLEGGVMHPDKYSINAGAGNNAQPPYVANRTSKFDQVLWSSLTNPAVQLDENHLVQVAWSENMFETVNNDPNLCADPNFDLLHYSSTNEGFKNQYLFDTIVLNIDSFSRPFDGYVSPNGLINNSCNSPSLNCFRTIIESSVPQGDAFYNIAVRNIGQSTTGVVIDITEPNIYMP